MTDRQTDMSDSVRPCDDCKKALVWTLTLANEAGNSTAIATDPADLPERENDHDQLNEL
jgi:hypothetical protein